MALSGHRSRAPGMSAFERKAGHSELRRTGPHFIRPRGQLPLRGSQLQISLLPQMKGATARDGLQRPLRCDLGKEASNRTSALSVYIFRLWLAWEVTVVRGSRITAVCGRNQSRRRGGHSVRERSAHACARKGNRVQFFPQGFEVVKMKMLRPL